MLLDMAADGGPALKMVVSYGGQIVRCSDTGKARYAGGENRIVRVGMSERLSELRARLAALAGYDSDVRIRYAVAGPGGDARLDTLHDVADEHGLWVLVTRLCCCHGGLAARDGRVRAFLFPVHAPAPDGIIGIPRPASSPSLLEGRSKRGDGGVAVAVGATTLQKAQSAMELSTWTTTTPASSVALTQVVDSGFEALAEIAAAQRSGTGNNTAASSSETSSSSSSGVVAASSSTTTGQADDSGFDALAAIAAAQSSATTENTASGATTTCAAQADSGFEAALLATVAVAGQVVLPRPAAAAVFYVVPVAPVVAVFFHAIPGNGCLIPAVL